MEPYWWLIVAVVMVIAEVLSQGLITIWFVIGGLLAFVTGFFGASFPVQIIVFLVVSLACLLLLRPLILKHRKIGEAHEPSLVGTRAKVIERIDAQAQTGRVETPDHMTWTALSADGEPIEAGTQVSIIEQRSIKLVVSREL